MKIAITKGSGDQRYENYAEWFKRLNRSVETVDLSVLSSAQMAEVMQDIDGIVFVGGVDIDPIYYGKPEEKNRCKNIDKDRDAMEFGILPIALERRIPILGVCRGEQLINIFLGGTMFVDLPADHPGTVDHIRVTEDKWHDMQIAPDSMIGKRMKGAETGMVNSAHHQGVDRIADTLRPIGWAPDGLIEAYEWADPADTSFLLAVQWHPERMPPENPLSHIVGESFLEAVTQYAQKNPS